MDTVLKYIIEVERITNFLVLLDAPEFTSIIFFQSRFAPFICHKWH